MSDRGLAIRGGTVVTMDPSRAVARLDVEVGDDGRIRRLTPPGAASPAERTIDAAGQVVVPGLVQAHVHLCQTLFRGLSEDRPLLRWLRERIWPLEAAHDRDSMRAAARLGIAELLLGGTTAVLDMGTVGHADALFEAAADMGIRYTGGKATMDRGDGVPSGLLEETDASLAESDRLAARWHGQESGRLRYAYCPRFALSCSRELMRAVAERSASGGFLVHTHASEQREETGAVRRAFGVSNIELLVELGFGGPRACLAHCVWPEPGETALLAGAGGSVVHCPSCNMKLGSGIAPVADYLAAGVGVALGADGAASNNRLDGWEQLRLAGLLAKLRGGPEALSAVRLFELATLGGARALGLGDEIGSVEPGKWVDLAILDLGGPHAAGHGDVYTTLVYAARASDVRTVLVGGRIAVCDGRLVDADADEIVAEAAVQTERLLRRSGVDEEARVRPGWA